MPKRKTSRIAKAAAVAAFCAAWSTATPPANCAAAEPAEAFANRLRAVGYFDTAILYLDRIDRYPGVPASFVEAIPLEKAQTHIDAAVAARSTRERDSLFIAAETELKKFLDLKSHPRFSEAQLKLGKLQLVRANQLMSAADPTDEARGNARQSCLDASATFDSIVQDLRGKLEEMRGQRIDAAKEPEKAAQRDQYRFEFLQAMIRSGEAKKLAAETYREPTKDGRPLLEQALATFVDLSEKYGAYLEGATAMLYRAQVQSTLGDSKSAIDSFQRVLEQPDVDPLRPTRLQAMTGLIEIQLAASPPQIDEAVAQGKQVLDSVRANERRTAEFAQLQVALANAYLANADKLKAEGKAADARQMISKNARPLLIAAAKVPGLHEMTARDLLAKLGVDQDETSETPVFTPPKSLDEALTAARDLLLTNEELTKSKQTLAETIDKGGPEAETAATELEAVEQQLKTGRDTLVALLRGGLAIGGGEADAANQARQYLAFTLFQRGDFWDAAAVGSFLSRSAASKPEGLRGGLMALSSLQTLMRDLPKESAGGLIRQIELLGGHLTKTWPNEPQAAAAQGILIRLALDDDSWEDARRLLAEMPEGAERAMYQRLMGQLLWNRSLMLRQQNQIAQADELLPQAATELKSGLDGIPGALSGPEALQAALVLAKIEMKRGDAKTALDVLDSDKYGPTKLVATLGEPSDGFASDLYAVELQAVVGVMTAPGSDTQQLLKRATDVMQQLQGSVKDKPDANDRLVRIYIGMARDIRDQFESADQERKTELIAAFRVFLDSIAKSSKEPATLQWAGQTLMQMGESSMGENDIRAQGQAAELMTSAITILESLRDRLGAQAPATLKFQLGRAYRLAGEYKKAIDLFEEILKGTPMMVDTQIEAAKAYQQWAEVIGPQFAAKAFESALNGARPGADGKNLIWGWGRISKMISGRPEFRDQFFDARYQIAFCRFKMGRASNNTKVIEQAISDINQVAALYPELGGEKRRNDFDLLMKDIQRALGKKPDGLPAPKKPPG